LLDHTPETFFEGVYRIPAKTSLVLSMDDGTITTDRYWDHSLEPVGTFEQSAEHFRELFEDSVRIRLRSDVPVGSLLSGGLDSSAVATLCHQAGANVETFSVVSDDRRFSEEAYIDSVTRQTGVPNHKLVFRCPELLRTLDRMLIHHDEPVASLSIVAQYNIFRLVGEQHDVTVLLSGQGADEILLGYSKFFFFYLRSLLRAHKWGSALNELLGSFLKGTVVRHARMADARRYIPRVGRRPYGGALRLASEYLPVPIWQSHDMRQRQIADIDSFSVPVLTRYEDRNSMAHSLEIRNPFLDHRLVNFVTSLPTDYKIRNGWTKYILRESFPDLPASVRWRKDKKAFVTAEEKWIRGDLRPLVQAMFRNSCLGQMGVMDEKKFLVFYDDFLRGNSTHFGEISRALIAERWVRNILESRPPGPEPADLGAFPIPHPPTGETVRSTVV
jgi:asparagine synthase (glutamine-hydrolysing)